MENNNEVERAKAWFNGQSSENLFRLHRQYFPEVSLLSKGLSDVQIVHIYNAEHPESKEPKSDAAVEAPSESRIIQVIKAIPQQPQVQYDLQRQLTELRVAANRLGLYDAADFIK